MHQLQFLHVKTTTSKRAPLALWLAQGLFLALTLLINFTPLQPARAEICLEAQQLQAQINARARAEGRMGDQFVLAEVQNTDYECGMYQRFFIDKNQVDGDTAYALSRFLYFIFNDERVLSYEGNPAETEQARVAYFWALETAPRPVAVHNIDGVITMAPPTAAEIATAADFQALRADPAGLQQMIQIRHAYDALPEGNDHFNALQNAALNFLKRHWNVQSASINAGDCGA